MSIDKVVRKKSLTHKGRDVENLHVKILRLQASYEKFVKTSTWFSLTLFKRFVLWLWFVLQFKKYSTIEFNVWLGLVLQIQQISFTIVKSIWILAFWVCKSIRCSKDLFPGFDLSYSVPKVHFVNSIPPLAFKKICFVYSICKQKKLQRGLIREDLFMNTATLQNKQ